MMVCSEMNLNPKASVASIAKDLGINVKTFWNWYNAGSRLIQLRGGGM